MSPEALHWIKAVHIFGILMWVGTLMALYQVMFAFGEAKTDDARETILVLMRRVAVAMDVGATIAIGGGLGLLHGIQPSPLKLPWMHVKLTLVLLFIGFHIYGRIKLRKLRNGEDKSTPPPILFALLNLILIGIIIMAVVKPF